MLRWIVGMLASRPPCTCAQQAPCMVQLEIDTASARTLRWVVMRSGADAVRFLRIGACGRGGKVSALLCVDADAVHRVQQAIARFLPDCECRRAA